MVTNSKHELKHYKMADLPSCEALGTLNLSSAEVTGGDQVLESSNDSLELRRRQVRSASTSDIGCLAAGL